MLQGQSPNEGTLPNNLGQFAIFDWLEFTIFYDVGTYLEYYDLHKKKSYISEAEIDYKVYLLIKDLFGLYSGSITHEKRGRNGYTDLYNYKNINVWTTTNAQMGIHVEISGQGCRDLEDLHINIFTFIKKVESNYRVKYSRIDLSIDDFTNKYYDLKKIHYYLKNKLISTKLRTFYNTTSGIVDSYDLLGHTLQFGSKGGLIHITFYDKLKERRANNYIVDDNIKVWTRTEVRFRNEKAKDVIQHIIERQEINSIIKGVLKHYIRFLYKSPDCKDSNKSRLETVSWWNDFLDNVEDLQLMNPKVFSTIQKKKVWIDGSVSKSQFMVYCSQLETTKLTPIDEEYFRKQLELGCNKITTRDLNMINQERINNNLLPFTEDDVKDILRGLKDMILINNK